MKRMMLAAALAVAAATIVALPARGAEALPAGPVGTGNGVFQAVCTFSHRLSDDPIVFPRGPGASHSHDFFGSRSTSAMSTPESIASAPTNCLRSNSPAPRTDRSAYWVPTLSVGAVAIKATQMGAYYKAGIRHVAGIEPFPAGLKIIAGTASGGPSEVSGERVWSYLCPGGRLAGGDATTAPTCKTPRMDVVIRFPDCWDGVNLDSANHKSHMAYSRRTSSAPVRTCPATHPRLVPMLEIAFRYPTAGGPATRLASGTINTAHADFVNGWDVATQARLVRDCLRVDGYCGGGDVVVH